MEIMGMGKALPTLEITNNYLSQIVDTNDEWISSRTGIKTRFFASDEETNISLASMAAKNAVANANIAISDIGICVVATFTPDNNTPSVACMVAKELCLNENTLCFDINAACSGFVYALNIVNSMLKALPTAKYGLVIGSEVISRYMDMKDRNTCILFGDGAGAAIIKLNNDKICDFDFGTVPNDEVLYCKATDRKLQMQGKEVFRFAVTYSAKSIENILDKNNLNVSDIDFFVCHQANRRIIEALSKKLSIDLSKFYINLDKYGNTSAASIPIALSEMFEEKLLKKDDKIICVGFGGGLTYGSTLITI
ncbi:MAG: beta-ketoacyl-ACP synthase III [Oscillospiraceae bacterium]